MSKRWKKLNWGQSAYKIGGIFFVEMPRPELEHNMLYTMGYKHVAVNIESYIFAFTC